MRQGMAALALVFLTALMAQAEAPDASLRPLARPDTIAAASPVGSVPPRSLRPRARPAETVAEKPATALPAAAPVPSAVPKPSDRRLSRMRPEPRPDLGGATVQNASVVRIRPGKALVFGRKGSVCGVPGIKGETLAPITSRVQGCGIADPVRVTSVDGVALSMAATLDCPTARALHDWVQGALKPAFGRSDVAQLQVAAHYACRPRNNVKGAPVSEHGRGKAIDIAAIVLQDGTTVSVLDDWRSRAGKPMVKAYRAACGTFGTTLGPEADRHHRNHLHFDTAPRGNGAYCR